MSEKKASEQRKAAAPVDPRQLELMLANGVERANGAATAAPQGADADRARAILSSLDRLSSEEVFAAFEELDALPRDVVRAVLAASTGPVPDPELLDDAIRRAHGFPPRALHLRTIAIVKDADIFDLGPVAEEQVRLAGKSWDGRDLPAEERLDEEIEGSFAGTLEHHTLAEAGKPLFDVLRYAGDAGAIFRTGTAELVGAIAYDTVEMKDRRARVAVQDALTHGLVPEAVRAAEPSPVEVPEAAAPRAATAAKPAARKPAAEKAPAKKPAAKASAEKAAVEKAPAKKVTAKPAAKKPAVEKATANKVAAKPAAKKPAAEKVAPKKAPAKASAKKPAAEKAAAKKAPAKASAKKPSGKPSAVEKPAAKKATAEKLVATKSAAEKAGAKKTGAATNAKKATMKAPAKKAPAKKG